MDVPPASVRQPKGHFLRVLGVGFGIAVSLGNCIGSGIMRTPSEIAGRLPSVALIMSAWIVGALYSLVGAWSVSEVGAMIPSAGALYAVARRAFGDYVSFVVGWTDCVSLCAAIATITILAGEYFGDLVPRFANHNASLAMGLTLALALIQVGGIRWGSRFQDVATAITALVFLSIIAGTFLLPHHSLHSASTVLSMPVLSMPKGFALFAAWTLVLKRSS